MKKKGLIIISILFVVFVIAGGIYANNYRIENGAARYLAKKYNWEISDIKEIEHQKGYIDYSLFPLDFYFNKYNPKWVYEYNGRKFNVEYTNFHFADDYQLEDIFTWCTEYLQNNVDKDIVGVEIYSDIIYQSSDDSHLYDYELPWSKNIVFHKEDATRILKEIAEHKELHIYYRTSNLLDYGNKTVGHYIDEIGNQQTYNYYIPNNKYDKFFKNKEALINAHFDTENLKIVIYSKGEFGVEPIPSTDKSVGRSIYCLKYESTKDNYVTK